MAKAIKPVEVTTEELATELTTPETSVEVTTETKTTEQLVAEFTSKQKGEYSLNSFLKSVPVQHDKATHLKQLGGIITKLNLKVKGDTHLQLGKHYYDGDAKQCHIGLDDVDILVEK